MKTIEFLIYPELDSQLKAKAIINDNNEIIKVKLSFKAGKGYYYHFLNDALNEANEKIKQLNNMENKCR